MAFNLANPPEGLSHDIICLMVIAAGCFIMMMICLDYLLSEAQIKKRELERQKKWESKVEYVGKIEI
tara:strand:+ start:157 stop:357 length:201 start_codon:yes stop_codon:yes gene_type:complete